MNIIVLGGGMVGSAIVADLSKDFQVTCADINPQTLQSIESKYMVKTLICDFANQDEVKNTIAPFDLVIGAVPGFLGFKVLKTIITAKKNVVDISFFPEDAFLLNDLAIKNNVTAIVDCGVAPGLCNIMLGYHNKRMILHAYECLVGGLPLVRNKPWDYKAPFSPVDVIEEYTRPARYKEDGKMITKEALTDIEPIEFNECGTLEHFNTDGLRSILFTMPHIKNLKEKTLRNPGHATLMKIFRDSGFFSTEKLNIKNTEIAPIDLTSKLLFDAWKYQPDEHDFTIMRVTLTGSDDQGDLKIIYNLYDVYDVETSIMSMARTTGYTCTAAARMVLNNTFTRKGISPPEFLGENEDCFTFIENHLKERKVTFTREIYR
ncbi:MAG: saccharopine dehydrogenase C-terminal domain-containing protein [Bacteroidota bacterium]